MWFCLLDWDFVNKVVQVIFPIISIVLSIFSFVIAIIALHYNRLKLRININTTANQGSDKKYVWSVKLSISNSGYTPFSIVKIIDKNKKEINFSNNGEKLPLKFDPGEIKFFSFQYLYSTKNNYIFAYDHKGKSHKIKISKEPSFYSPDTFKELWTDPKFRTFGDLKSYIVHKFRKKQLMIDDINE